MSKAFTRETDGDGDGDEPVNERPALPPGAKNYFTPEGHARLKAELEQLLRIERPQTVTVVSWAAGNGDRSENGDYIYGKKRLREIDRRIRFLTKRLDNAEVVDPAQRRRADQVFFGATVIYADGSGAEHTVKIVGVDEVDPESGHVSWISPVGHALLKARVGDAVRIRTPRGAEEITVRSIRYDE